MLKPKPQQNLREVIRRAFDGITGRRPGELAECAGGRARGRVIEIELLGRALAVDLDAREVRMCVEGASAGPVDEGIAAVVARYVMLCAGLPRDPGPEIGFADHVDARGYLVPFRGRVVAPLVAKFGREPEGFARAAEELGGERRHLWGHDEGPHLEDPGTEGAGTEAAGTEGAGRSPEPASVASPQSDGPAAYRLAVLPRIALTFVLHPGDDELPAEGQVLFPRALFDVLAVDDLVATAELASRALRGRLWRE